MGKLIVLANFCIIMTRYQRVNCLPKPQKASNQTTNLTKVCSDFVTYDCWICRMRQNLGNTFLFDEICQIILTQELVAKGCLYFLYLEMILQGSFLLVLLLFHQIGQFLNFRNEIYKN